MEKTRQKLGKTIDVKAGTHTPCAEKYGTNPTEPTHRQTKTVRQQTISRQNSPRQNTVHWQKKKERNIGKPGKPGKRNIWAQTRNKSPIIKDRVTKDGSKVLVKGSGYGAISRGGQTYKIAAGNRLYRTKLDGRTEM